MYLFRFIAVAGAFAAASAYAQQDRLLTPPPEWADYAAAVRKAEAIADIEQRCLAYPDMPDNEWRAGAAQARCALNRAPALSLEAIERMLGEPEGVTELDRRFAALLDAHYNDVEQREQIFVQYDVFDSSDSARKVADAWVGKAPESAFARTASGLQFVEAAWEARGDALAYKTARDKFERMGALGARGVAELDKALASNQKLSPACKGLMHIGQMTSNDDIVARAVGHCIEVDPASYRVIWAWQGLLAPHWGGSLEAERHVVAFAAARVDKNPMLGALLATQLTMAGREYSSRDESSKSEEAYLAASRIAPDAEALGWYGVAARKAGDQWKAFAYLSQSIRFRPEDDVFLRTRAYVRIALGDYSGAVSDGERALAIEPADGGHAYALGEAHKLLHHTVEARNAYRKAMDDPETRQSGQRRWCESHFFSDADLPKAVACTKDLVAAYPTWGEAWHMRAWVLNKARDPSASEAGRKFLQYADMQNPAHRKLVDTLRAESGTPSAARRP